MHQSRKALTAALIAATTAALVLTPTSANAATGPPDPSVCSGKGDHGSGGSFDTSDSTVVYGTWYNCSGGTGADRVRLQVGNHADPSCITVSYGSAGTSTMTTVKWVFAYYQGWTRC